MENNIITVGFKVPGHSDNYVGLSSNKSLMDGDIIIFRPNFDEFDKDYQKSSSGLPQIKKDDSRKLLESVSYWKQQISDALNHGKTIFFILHDYEKVSVYTGQTAHSGTGRSLRQINYVSEENNYSYLPVEINLHPCVGSIIKKGKDFNILSEFWDNFKDNISYSMYLDQSDSKQILITKTGDKIVSSSYCLGQGHLILLPKIEYNYDQFIEENTDGEQYCTSECMESK